MSFVCPNLPGPAGEPRIEEPGGGKPGRVRSDGKAHDEGVHDAGDSAHEPQEDNNKEPYEGESNKEESEQEVSDMNKSAGQVPHEDDGDDDEFYEGESNEEESDEEVSDMKKSAGQVPHEDDGDDDESYECDTEMEIDEGESPAGESDDDYAIPSEESLSSDHLSDTEATENGEKIQINKKDRVEENEEEQEEKIQENEILRDSNTPSIYLRKSNGPASTRDVGAVGGSCEEDESSKKGSVMLDCPAIVHNTAEVKLWELRCLLSITSDMECEPRIEEPGGGKPGRVRSDGKAHDEGVHDAGDSAHEPQEDNNKEPYEGESNKEESEQEVSDMNKSAGQVPHEDDGDDDEFYEGESNEEESDEEVSDMKKSAGQVPHEDDGDDDESYECDTEMEIDEGESPAGESDDDYAIPSEESLSSDHLSDTEATENGEKIQINKKDRVEENEEEQEEKIQENEILRDSNTPSIYLRKVLSSETTKAGKQKKRVVYRIHIMRATSVESLFNIFQVTQKLNITMKKKSKKLFERAARKARIPTLM
ncbi:uncharacterized protein DDB_G0290685-like [Asterias rubens]|uniref:uncharacterized protein DDB_G0290685-like n=1 Tax=Asterias rubens TaxID=7604 RepID=UPI00145561FD|nr:uncharacterized protein DDB_G0290685-like [Asterias rubens]